MVSSSFLSSLNVSDSFTESALRIPSRRRSWISRSSLGAPTAARLPPSPRIPVSFRVLSVLRFAYPPYFTAITVPKMMCKSAKARRQQRVARQPGHSSAAAPAAMKHAPISGHDPHRSAAAGNHCRRRKAASRCPAETARIPPGTSTPVSSAPASIAGSEPGHEFARRAREQRHLARRDLSAAPTIPISQRHQRLHRPRPPATAAAASAATPATPPPAPSTPSACRRCPAPP